VGRVEECEEIVDGTRVSPLRTSSLLPQASVTLRNTRGDGPGETAGEAQGLAKMQPSIVRFQTQPACALRKRIPFGPGRSSRTRKISPGLKKSTVGLLLMSGANRNCILMSAQAVYLHQLVKPSAGTFVGEHDANKNGFGAHVCFGSKTSGTATT